MTTTPWVRAWLRHGLATLLLLAGCVGQAEAGVTSCAVLVNQFSPQDIGLAYQFIKDHGECLAHLEDPAFQTVAGALTAATTTGVLKTGQCTSLLNMPNSQAAKQVLAVADAGVVGAYLDCGCAVADSGIAQKIQGLVEDVVACAKSVDPVAAITTGAEKAGDLLGLSTLWGMAGPDHDPRAGVGNGGAEQEAYDVANCPATGVPYAGWTHYWSGAPLPPGERVWNCHCPAPTRPYADGQFIDIGPGFFHGPTFTCLTCPPGTAKDKYGNCSQCLNKVGLAGLETWEPNRDGSSCTMTHVEPINSCKPDEHWNGRNGLSAVCCPSWQTVSKDGNSCERTCPRGRIWNGKDCEACPPDTEEAGNVCRACPDGEYSNYADSCKLSACPDGQGLLPGGTECMACPPDTQLKQGGHCEPCTQGAHSKGGSDFCSISYFGGGVGCPANTVHPPGDTSTCVCAPGTELVAGQCQAAGPAMQSIGSGALRNLTPAASCPPERRNADGSCAPGCSGATVPNPQRPGSCMACPEGSAPNATHSACQPVMRLRPVLQRIGG